MLAYFLYCFSVPERVGTSLTVSISNWWIPHWWLSRVQHYLLNDMSGQALRGQVTTILGPSGAGKSTFLDALAGGIARGSLEGAVSIDGRPVSFLF